MPMALYKHVASKEELLDGMVDIVVGEIDPPVGGTGWKTAIRQRILSARRSLPAPPLGARGHRVARADPSPVVLGYIDSMIGMFRAGGFSADLTHHALHALGSRLYGFTQEIFDDSQGLDPQTGGDASPPDERQIPAHRRNRPGGVPRRSVRRRPRL